MLNAKDVFTVVLRSAFLIALISIPSPVAALTGFKNWSRKILNQRVNLCTQPCYSQILPGLYLSNARAAGDRTILRSLNITHVLTIETRRIPKSVISNTNITTLFIRAYDLPQTNLLPYFPMANAFIEEGRRQGNVLVHCHFGVSRSATLVIAYLMQRNRWTYDQAFEYVRQRRNFINPNPGFVNQLRQYHKSNYEVSGYCRFEAYMNVIARKYKYKIASMLAVMVGVMVPIVVLVG